MSYVQGNPDTGIVVPFSDDASEEVRDDELIVDDDKPGVSPEERVKRKERRQARLQGLLQDGKRSAERVKELEERDAKRERELAELRGMITAQQQIARQQPGDGKDPFEAELDAIYAEQQSAYAAAQAEAAKPGGLSPERQAHYERVARDIETRKTAVHTRRALAQTEPVRQQAQAQQVWVQKYPEVYRNPNAFQYAQGRAQTRVALGEVITPAVVDEIMNETMAQFKLGPKPPPTQTERSRLSGVASSGGGGGGGKGEGIALTKEVRRMAVAAYDHLPEEEAVKKWVQKTGKKLREKKVL